MKIDYTLTPDINKEDDETTYMVTIAEIAIQGVNRDYDQEKKIS